MHIELYENKQPTCINCGDTTFGKYVIIYAGGLNEITVTFCESCYIEVMEDGKKILGELRLQKV